MKTTVWRLAALLLTLALVAAACGGDDDDTAEDSGDGGSGESGNIAISGSSTVEPISVRNAEAFSAANPGVAISVEGPGTGDGFKLFCSGETDISDASRAIKDSEVEDCANAGVEWVEIQVAIDGISVLTNPANESVSCLNNGDMYALVGPESIGIDTWAGANELAAEVGGNGGLPDAPLTVTAPGEESGTYDTFVELVLEDIADERGQDPVARPDYVASPNDNVIVEGIEGSETSFGWVGYAFYVENQDQLKAIEVADEAGTCVAPTPETIASGEYPLSRPLFIYVNTQKYLEKPELAEFVQFYVSPEGIAAVGDAGYVELESYDEAVATVEAIS